MASVASEPFDLREQLARIDKMIAETEQSHKATRKMVLESEHLQASTAKTIQEQAQILAATRKIAHDMKMTSVSTMMQVLVAFTGLMAAVVAATKAFL